MPRGYRKDGSPLKTSFKKGHKVNLGKKNGLAKGLIPDNYYFRKKNALAQTKTPKPEQCEVCGAIGRICFDHNHETGEFRGWLCVRCNVALGMVKDNSETLIALANYLIKSKI